MMRQYDSGQLQPETGASVSGGILVHATQREELLQLQKLGHRIWLDPGNTSVLPVSDLESHDARLLRRFYGSLLGGVALRPDDGHDDMPSAVLDTELVRRLLDLPHTDDFLGLLCALEALADCWGEDPDGDGEVQLLLMLATPGPAPVRAAELSFSRPRAVLGLRNGSLIAELSVSACIKATRWSMVLIRAASARPAGVAVRRLVEGSRRRARLDCKHDLTRLDALRAQDVAIIRQKPLLLVFIHGLFGTDLQTFDALISRLQQATPEQLRASVAASCNGLPTDESGGLDKLVVALDGMLEDLGDRLSHWRGDDVRGFMAAQVSLVGWPHNTLAGVEENAAHLADLIDNQFSPDGPRIFFVCHSRGGLVARAAAARLLERVRPQRDWGEALAGIATFGTPHDGAAIAESTVRSARELAVYFMMLRATRQWTSVGDVLDVLDSRSTEGIENLKPADATTAARPSSLVSVLYQAEGRLRDELGQRRPPVLAVGGKVNDVTWSSWRRRAAAAFIGRQLDGEEHDMVVELSSTLSRRLCPRHAIGIGCDHFAYFDGGDESLRGIDAAVAWLWVQVRAQLGRWAEEHPPGRIRLMPIRASFRRRPRSDSDIPKE